MTILLSWLCWGADQEEVCLDPCYLCNLTLPRLSVELPIKERLLQPADLKNALPAYIQDGLEQTFQRYSREIELLQAVRQAGIIGLFKRREAAMKAFSRYIDEESREIMVIGSSLKGLLQKEEYQDLAGKLKFKHERGLVKVKFLLTHLMSGHIF